MAYAPATDVGTLKLLTTTPTSWLLSGVTSVGSWTTTTAFRVWSPLGTKALYLQGAIVFSGNGVIDYVDAYFRKTGSGHSANQTENPIFDFAYLNLGAGINAYAFAPLIVLCDSNRDIDYQTLTGGSLYATILGYFS